MEARLPFAATPVGQALLALLRFAWSGAGRRELYAFLRSPYSGVPRAGVDFVEGRLRGRAISEPARVEQETERLREAPLVALRELRSAPSPLEGVRVVLGSMLRAAYGLEAAPSGEAAQLDLRSFGAVTALLEELAGLEALDEALTPDEVLRALAQLELPPPPTEPGRIVVLDLLAARTRRFQVVFVLGLEEGSLPRRDSGSPFLDEQRRRALGGLLERPEPVSRDRFLFYSACTRATERLYLVREAVNDDGSPREQSPFWDAAVEAFTPEQVERATRRRALSELTWPIEAAPTERERLRALARLSADPQELELALALAGSNDWTRRLNRARSAFTRATRLSNPALLAQLGARTVFGATELERFGDCSSAWFFERLIDPKTIDAQADALLRGKVAHQTLYAFYSGLPRELGVDRVSPETLEPSLAFLARCLDDAFGSGVRIELAEVEAAELREGLWRDLERFVRDEAVSELAFVPRRFELGFGTDRSAPELQRGLELGEGLFASGKIDRIDIDQHSARGIVQDYKSGKGSFSARQIDVEQRLQVPLYMLVLRDLAGIEPLGGVYRALSGARAARGMLRGEAREELPGFKANDYLDEEQFWLQVETARARALAAAKRIRRGELAHDPRGGECPELVRPVDDVPGGALLMNARQLAVVAARGEVFVSAGAGTGKTSVLVERFVSAVCDEGLDVDSVLVITYTRKAAGELRARIRGALAERGRLDLARDLDGAWISTIHGFCARLLRAHSLAAGIDPRFHELDDEQAAVLRGEAFARALDRFCADREPERLRLLATYGGGRLRSMLTGVYATLRSAGRALTLELGPAPTSASLELEVRRAAAESQLADRGATANQREAARGAAARPAPATVEALIDLEALRTRGSRAAGFEEARRRVAQAALDEAAGRDRDLLQELLVLFAAEYAAAKESESALDFEDLQLIARDLLSANLAIREAEQLRFRAIMVDEFQDTNALQCELVDLLAASPATAEEPAPPGAGAKDVFFVGDEFQSIYGFRHADVAVFRERGERAASRLTLSENYRSRPEVLAAVNHLFGEEFGDGYQPLAASGEFPDPVFGLHPSRAAPCSPTRSPTATRASTGAGPRRATSPAGSGSSSMREPRCPARSCSCSPPEPTPSGTRRSCEPRGSRPTARPGGGTSPSSRWSTC